MDILLEWPSWLTHLLHLTFSQCKSTQRIDFTMALISNPVLCQNPPQLHQMRHIVDYWNVRAQQEFTKKLT